MQTPNSVIALTGDAGVGKSAVARELVRHHGYKRMSLAYPLKLMLRAVLVSWGFNAEACDYWIDGEGKEKPCPALAGQSPRRAMQLLGTELGRQGLGENVWIDHLVTRAAREGHSKIVVDDVRFDNEANAMAVRLGATNVKIEAAPGKRTTRNPPPHASENGVSPELIDAYLVNDFTFDGVHDAVTVLVATCE